MNSHKQKERIWGYFQGLFITYGHRLYFSPSSTSRTTGVIYVKICHAVLSILLCKGWFFPWGSAPLIFVSHRTVIITPTKREFLSVHFCCIFLFWHVDGGLAYHVPRLSVVYKMLHTTFWAFFFFFTVFM